mmetsp:Transcript_49013/g.110210  ORF Transcript_49013/g.110210 Transcript_49013/m.110210 type:complete len:205 (+) Transcript_49013:54-668(+)
MPVGQLLLGDLRVRTVVGIRCRFVDVAGTAQVVMFFFTELVPAERVGVEPSAVSLPRQPELAFSFVLSNLTFPMPSACSTVSWAGGWFLPMYSWVWSYMSWSSSTLWVICSSISSSRASLLSPRTGAYLISVAWRIALLRCFSLQDDKVLEKSCSMAICMTPTWPSFSSFSARALFNFCSSSWLSARCRSRLTWHSCRRLLIIR